MTRLWPGSGPTMVFQVGLNAGPEIQVDARHYRRAIGIKNRFAVLVALGDGGRDRPARAAGAVVLGVLFLTHLAGADTGLGGAIALNVKIVQMEDAGLNGRRQHQVACRRAPIVVPVDIARGVQGLFERDMFELQGDRTAHVRLHHHVVRGALRQALEEGLRRGIVHGDIEMQFRGLRAYRRCGWRSGLRPRCCRHQKAGGQSPLRTNHGESFGGAVSRRTCRVECVQYAMCSWPPRG